MKYKKDNNNENKPRFNLFNRYAKDGPGVEKDEETEKIIENPNFINFFKLFGRKFRDIFSINAYIILGNFPVFFAIFAMSGYPGTTTTTPYHQIYAPLRGALKFESSAVSAALGNIFGIEVSVPVYTTASYVFFALAALVLLTFGIVNVGTSYNLRNLIRSEPVFMWADFWYAVKKNLRQGIIYGIIDLILIFLLAYDVVFLYYNLGPMMMNIMFYFSLFAAVIYFFMRFYIYMMMVTFDLSLFKLFKNGLIFALLGFKRNVLALLGIVLIIALNYSLLLMYVPVGIIVPFIILFGAGSFIAAYAAYPKIKEIMIDPYSSEQEDD